MQVTATARQAVADALALLPPPMHSRAALAMLYAIGLQESRFEHRRQLGGGPARGLWQFERGGGVRGVCEHAASRYWMSAVCDARAVRFEIAAVYAALETDDVLAAAAARLLLFTDPRFLPALDDAQGAWDLYARVWRPGKPHRATWAECHTAALDALAEVPA